MGINQCLRNHIYESLLLQLWTWQVREKCHVSLNHDSFNSASSTSSLLMLIEWMCSCLSACDPTIMLLVSSPWYWQHSKPKVVTGQILVRSLAHTTTFQASILTTLQYCLLVLLYLDTLFTPWMHSSTEFSGVQLRRERVKIYLWVATGNSHVCNFMT